MQKPIGQESGRLMAECLWSQMLHWMRTQQIIRPAAVTPPNEAVYQIGVQISCLWQPWLQPDFAEEFRLAFDALRLPRRAQRKAAGRKARLSEVGPI
jgi:hypothetical protein